LIEVGGPRTVRCPVLRSKCSRHLDHTGKPAFVVHGRGKLKYISCEGALT